MQCELEAVANPWLLGPNSVGRSDVLSRGATNLITRRARLGKRLSEMHEATARAYPYPRTGFSKRAQPGIDGIVEFNGGT